MAQESLKSQFGNEFLSMIEGLVAKEVHKSYTSHKFYDSLSQQFDENVALKLPDMRTQFKNLDAEIDKLENCSSDLDKELQLVLNTNSFYNNKNFSVSNAKKIDQFISSTSKSNGELNYPRNTKDLQNSRLNELKQHTKNGQISTDALYVGVSVLGLCKDEWKEGIIEDIQRHKDRQRYKVRFIKNKRKSLLQLNHIACNETPQIFLHGQIPTGSRIAANFKDEGIYSGVVAESADFKTNKCRYLIFYDDGYTMYCSIENVYLVYGKHSNVWNYIQERGTSEFVKDYLSVSEHQLLSLKEGQNLKVEFDGEWHRARCNKVDCSLVEILYFSDGSTEWIYRGSRRLEPLHMQYQLKISNDKTNKIARAHTGVRRAHIEIVDLTEDSSSVSNQDMARVEKKDEAWIAPWARSRTEQKAHAGFTAPTRIPNSFTELIGGYDVASKIQTRFNEKSSKFHQPNFFSNKIEVDDGIDVNSVSLSISKHSQSYIPHFCSFQCIAAFSRLTTKQLVGINPLVKPLLCGWTREICRLKPNSPRTSFHVVYRSPCGKACRNMEDVEQFMIDCNLKYLDYDHFCFDHTVRTIIHSSSQILSVTKPRDSKYFEPDYSNGKEDVPISCVNEINYEQPPAMPYTKSRVPGKDVFINTSLEYMVCCDCTDNCRDKSKCACQQLTVQATSCSHGSKIKAEAGYQFKRLYSFLPTGIYECNPRCKCTMQCKNRVVQKGLQCRLQMFKTHKKGWGIRCIDDIAQGTFVCIYTGRIETEANANQEGLLNGDEYLAELDHIEVAENQKDDYNSGDSSGFDSQGNSSDEENESNFGKQSRIQEDSTDTDDETDAVAERNIGPVTIIGGHKRKLGYSVDTVTPPSTSENIYRRKPMIVKKNNQKGNSYYNRFHPSTTQEEEDTTDTDSEPEITFNRTPTARKSTTTHTSNEWADCSSQTIEDIAGTRRYFGSEGTYIIDAKQTGNLGRYLNHSCTPNLMVQNVFIDTHDLRFPWVAFFANKIIRSGTELTWDYNYEIGSVPDRIIHCYCGSTKCRKRLL